MKTIIAVPPKALNSTAAIGVSAQTIGAAVVAVKGSISFPFDAIVLSFFKRCKEQPFRFFGMHLDKRNQFWSNIHFK
jgi:hypothetical protein